MDIDIEDDLFDDAVLFAATAIVKEEVVRKQDRKQWWDTTLPGKSIVSRLNASTIAF
jgi:hypothetical protein